MKVSTFAGILMLLLAAAFLAVIYLVAHARLSREELWVVAGFIGGGLLLLDPGDMKELAGKALDKLPWGKSQP
jgi:hypothetical protein